MGKAQYPGTSLSGIGGVETGADAAEFILLGSHTVQVGRRSAVVIVVVLWTLAVKLGSCALVPCFVAATGEWVARSTRQLATDIVAYDCGCRLVCVD